MRKRVGLIVVVVVVVGVAAGCGKRGVGPADVVAPGLAGPDEAANMPAEAVDTPAEAADMPAAPEATGGPNVSSEGPADSSTAQPPAKRPAIEDVPSIAWVDGFEDALAKAKEKNKPVMVEFYLEGSGPCENMEKESLAHPDVRRLSRKFVCTKVDYAKHKDIGSEYKIKLVPTLLFLRPDGSEINRMEHYVPIVIDAKQVDVMEAMQKALKKE